jgi:peptidoglycan/xylan/chitin deacetylase (PgdA/CDA1 family)
MIPILMYHQVDVPPPSGTPLRGMVVSPQAFAWQMQLIAGLGYRGLSMRELEPYLSGERRGRVLGITLDDGYRNNLVHALPVLQRRGFSATCYVVSDAVGATNEWDRGNGVATQPLMDEADLCRWAGAGMEIGAHSRSHADLTKLDDAQAREQISGCRVDLEARFGTPVRHFCYPYGSYGPREATLAREAGYLTATTTRRGRVAPGDDAWQLRRVLMAQATRPWHLLAKLLTRYEDKRG